VFTAFLDANVLVPVTLTDTVLRCAEKELFRPLWSDRVLKEVGTALVRVRQDLSPSRIDYRLGRMRAAFPEAAVRVPSLREHAGQPVASGAPVN